MLELYHDPAFFPALYGFLAGSIPMILIASVRGRLARSRARAKQKTADETIERISSEKSALSTEIGKLRSNVSRLIKHQGQLEGLAKSEDQKERELGRLVKATCESIQTHLQVQKSVILEAISAIPATRVAEPDTPGPVEPSLPDDLDFVPLENIPSASDESTAFEGLDADQSASKAESAANIFRAALNDKDS